MVEFQEGKTRKDFEDSAKAYATAKIVMLCIGIIAIVVGVLLAFWITRSIIQPLAEGVRVANLLAHGDLTVEVKADRKDEAGQLLAAMSAMVDKLKEIVSSIKGVAHNVASGAQQLTASSEQLSQGASEQAASAEEVSSSMEEMASNIKQSAENALQTEKIALRKLAERSQASASEIIKLAGSSVEGAAQVQNSRQNEAGCTQKQYKSLQY